MRLTHRPHRPRWTAVAAAAAGCAVLAGGLAACSDDSDGAEPAPSSTTSSSTPTETSTNTAPATPEEQAEADVRELLDTYFVITNDLFTGPAEDAGRLASVLTGYALERRTSYIEEFRSQGITVEGETVADDVVVTNVVLNDDNTGVVGLRVCENADGAVAYDSSGEPVVDPENRTAPRWANYEAWSQDTSNPDAWRFGVRQLTEEPCGDTPA